MTTEMKQEADWKRLKAIGKAMENYKSFGHFSIM
jgi:hypothetical protein